MRRTRQHLSTLLTLPPPPSAPPCTASHHLPHHALPLCVREAGRLELTIQPLDYVMVIGNLVGWGAAGGSGGWGRGGWRLEVAAPPLQDDKLL
jgi:hypothetical protein